MCAFFCSLLRSAFEAISAATSSRTPSPSLSMPRRRLFGMGASSEQEEDIIMQAASRAALSILQGLIACALPIVLSII